MKLTNCEEIELKCLAFRQNRTLLVNLTRPGYTLLAPLSCTMALLCGPPPPELGQDALSLLHLSIELAGEPRTTETGAACRLDEDSRLLGVASEASDSLASSGQQHAQNTRHQEPTSRGKAVVKLDELTHNLKLAKELASASRETLERLFEQWLCLLYESSMGPHCPLVGSAAPQTSTERTYFMVMISYNRREGRGYALKLKAALEELAISVYLDLHEICAGSDWQDSLNEALLNCRALVALVTPSYGETLWTRRELKMADVLGKRIIPVNFNAHWPPKSLAIQFATLQYVSWLTPALAHSNSNKADAGGRQTFPRDLSPFKAPASGADCVSGVAWRIWRALDKDIRDEDKYNAVDVESSQSESSTPDTCPASASLGVPVSDYYKSPLSKRKKAPLRTSAHQPTSPDAELEAAQSLKMHQATPFTWWPRRRRRKSGTCEPDFQQKRRKNSIKWCAAEACTRVKRLLI